MLLCVSFPFQLRRQARLRREYLYRKSVEDKERSILERKRKLRDALEGTANIRNRRWEFHFLEENEHDSATSIVVFCKLHLVCLATFTLYMYMYVYFSTLFMHHPT